MELENAFTNIIDKLESWLATLLVNLPNFVVAVIVVTAFYFLAKLSRKLLKKFLSQDNADIALRKLVARILYVAIIAAGVFIALSVLHLDKTVTSLLAGAGIIGLALSFAFQDVAANFISGLFLIINRPIKIGDQVKTNDYHGHIKVISLRSTVIETFQGQTITIPNRLIFENPIENISTNGTRRVDLEVGISYGENLEKVQEVAENALGGIESILQDKPVKLVYTGFGGSSINFKLLYWCCINTEPGYLQALTDGIKALKVAFDKEGISIPYPIRTLDFGIKGGEKLGTQLGSIGSSEE
jgi:small conductance mechanosensitive channel